MTTRIVRTYLGNDGFYPQYIAHLKGENPAGVPRQRDYDAACSLCWLGQTHTEAVHADRVAS